MEFKESRRPNQSRNSRVNYVIRQQKPITFSQLTAQEKQKIADYTASSSNAQSIIYNHLNSYSLNVENKDSLARNFAYNSYAQDISMSYIRFDDNLGSYFDSYLGVEKISTSFLIPLFQTVAHHFHQNLLGLRLKLLFVIQVTV